MLGLLAGAERLVPLEHGLVGLALLVQRLHTCPAPYAWLVCPLDPLGPLGPLGPLAARPRPPTWGHNHMYVHLRYILNDDDS